MRRTMHTRWTDHSQAGLALILAILGVALLSLGLSGCDDDDEGILTVDAAAPAVPDGVSTITGSQQVIVIWNANRESDLAGYLIYSGGSPDIFDTPFVPGDWDLIAEVGADFNYSDDGDGRPYHFYEDTDVENGFDYYYRIVAFDLSGNRSAPSTDFAVDTPRPEGTVFLEDANGNPALAGFDFSTRTRQGSGLSSSDLHFEWTGGVPYLIAAPGRVKIQDYGQVHFDVASWAPEFGWSATGRVEAVAGGPNPELDPGHTYILEIYDGDNFTGDFYYAKVNILGLTGAGVDLWWGYQEVAGLPELKQAARNAGRREAKPDVLISQQEGRS